MVMFSWRKMGNCLAHICVRPPFIGSCIGFPQAKHEKVLQVVKTDGKVLESSTPILVKDISVKFSGSGTSPAAERKEEASGGGVKRIKVVITKQQLQQLLTKEISFEEVLLGLERKSSSLDSPRNWKPKLESIPEGFE
ncbi:hypothetical protein SADUNF_Sadunf15G0004600 [Salix dunnii]|uniref:Uncharacterized protein n=1 Tax=Salix dunnii TaxID=1413687 RepID=A0A835MNA7_9ROSI|nr:hypothetical protein SADUNF_Sadunf15G0004600 [Salix dunnii]